MDRRGDGGKAPGTTVVEARLQVREILRETHDVRTVRLDNSGRRIPIHRAGQHVRLGVDTPGGLAWKGFSLSSPPTRPDSLDVTVKLNPDGVVSRAIHALNPGDSVLVKGPSGHFFFDPEAHPEPLFLIAAGIGVTPMMSILRSIRDLAIDRPVTLVYGCRSREDVIFSREWDMWPRETFRPIVTLSRPDPSWIGPSGRIVPEFLAGRGIRPDAGRFFVSGPGDFNATLQTWLTNGGAPADRAHVEVFGKRA